MHLKLVHIFIQFYFLTMLRASRDTLPKNRRAVQSSNQKDACICYDLWDPVCATDGKTYANTCELTCAQKTNQYLFGVCKSACPCCAKPFFNEPLPHEHAGFFGWDSKTGEIHQVPPPKARQSVKNGPNRNVCTDQVDNPDCFHTLQYDPVCGNDNVTYSNSGELGCQQRVRPCLEQACKGSCPCCPCSSTKTALN